MHGNKHLISKVDIKVIYYGDFSFLKFCLTLKENDILLQKYSKLNELHSTTFVFDRVQCSLKNNFKYKCTTCMYEHDLNVE